MSRKRERRKNESWKKQRESRNRGRWKKERGGRSRVIQFNVRARRHHLSQRTAGVLHKQKVRIDITKIFLIYKIYLSLVFFALTKNNRSNSLLRKRYKPTSLCLSRLRFIARRRKFEEEEIEETSTNNNNNFNASSSNLCERKSLEKKKN